MSRPKWELWQMWRPGWEGKYIHARGHNADHDDGCEARGQIGAKSALELRRMEPQLFEI